FWISRRSANESTSADTIQQFSFKLANLRTVNESTALKSTRQYKVLQTPYYERSRTLSSTCGSKRNSKQCKSLWRTWLIYMQREWCNRAPAAKAASVLPVSRGAK